MDFKPNCKSCLYLSMVLQRPVGCEQHATASAWSATAPAPTRPRPEAPVALPLGATAPSDPDLRSGEGLPNPDLMVLFSRAEYQRLCALRVRVRDQLRRGRQPDDLGSGRGRREKGGGPVG